MIGYVVRLARIDPKCSGNIGMIAAAWPHEQCWDAGWSEEIELPNPTRIQTVL